MSAKIKELKNKAYGNKKLGPEYVSIDVGNFTVQNTGVYKNIIWVNTGGCSIRIKKLGNNNFAVELYNIKKKDFKVTRV